MNAPIQKHWLNIGEAAERVGVCRKKMSSYFEDGLRHISDGSLKRTTAEEIDRYMWAKFEVKGSDDLGDILKGVI